MLLGVLGSISMETFMKRLLSMFTMAGLLVAAPVALAAAPGDYNDDGVVDDTDKAIIFDAVGTKEGDPGFVPAADHDGDGVISLADVSDFSQILLNQ